MGKVERSYQSYQRIKPYTCPDNPPVEISDLENSWLKNPFMKKCAEFLCGIDHQISEFKYDKIEKKLRRFQKSLKSFSSEYFIYHVLTVCIEVEFIYINAIKDKKEHCPPTIDEKTYELWNSILGGALCNSNLDNTPEEKAFIAYVFSRSVFLDHGKIDFHQSRHLENRTLSTFFQEDSENNNKRIDTQYDDGPMNFQYDSDFLIRIAGSISGIDPNVSEDEPMDQSVPDEDAQTDDLHRNSEAQTSGITTTELQSQDSESECSGSTEIYFDDEDSTVLCEEDVIVCEEDQVKNEISLLDSLNPEIKHFYFRNDQDIARFSKHIRETRNTEFTYVHSKIDASIEIANVPEIGQLGVFAIENIESGTRLGCYEGERKTKNSETRGRYPNYYLWEIKKDKDKDKVLIDASKTASFTAFMNHSSHSCNVFSKVEDGKVVFYAKCPINPGDQLLYDYGNLYFENLNKKPVFLDPSDDWKSPAEKVVHDKRKVNLTSNECVKILGFPKDAHLFLGDDGVLYAAEKISGEVYRFYSYQDQSKATELMLYCYLGNFGKVEQLAAANPSILSRATLHEGRNALMYVILGKGDLVTKIKMIRAMSQVVADESLDERWIEIILALDAHGKHVIDYCFNLSDEKARKELASVLLKPKVYDRLCEIYLDRVLNLGDKLSDLSDDNKGDTVSKKMRDKFEKIKKQADSLKPILSFIKKIGRTKRVRNFSKSIMELIKVFLICVEFEKNNSDRIKNNIDRIKKLSNIRKKYDLYNLDKFGPYILRTLAVFHENLGVSQWNNVVENEKMDLIFACTLNYIESYKIYDELRIENEKFNFMPHEILDARYRESIRELFACLKACNETIESWIDTLPEDEAIESWVGILPEELLIELKKICSFLNTNPYNFGPDQFFKPVSQVNPTSKRLRLGN